MGGGGGGKIDGFRGSVGHSTSLIAALADLSKAKKIRSGSRKRKERAKRNLLS